MSSVDQQYTYPSFPNSGPSDDRVRLWGARRERSRQLKGLYLTRWKYCWQAYRNYSPPLTSELDWWRESTSIPTCYKIIETLLPRYILGMFNSPDFFTVEASQARSQDYEKIVEQLLRTTLEDMHLFPKMYEALKYTLIMGHCWGKVVWREEYAPRQVLVPTPIPYGQVLMDQFGPEAHAQAMMLHGEEALSQPSPVMGVETQTVEEEVYNAPDFEWRALDKVFPDPTGEYRWMIEDIPTTIEMLNETQAQVGVYDQRAMAMLKDTIRQKAMTAGAVDALGMSRAGTGAGVAVDYPQEPQYTEHIPIQYVSSMMDGHGVMLWQCWGRVSPEQRKYKDTQDRLIVIAEGKYVLRDDPAPTPDGKPPYFPMKSIVIPGRLYGESIVNLVGPLADQQSQLANMRIEEVRLGIWGQFLARKDSIMSDNQLLVQPGGIMQVEPRPGERVQDTFAQLQRQPMMPEAYNEDQYRQQQAEHASFASDIFQGASPGAGTTATEVERRLQQGGAPHVLSVMFNDYTVVKELLTRTWKWLQMRLPATKVVRMLGDQYAMVNIADIQIPVDIIVGGGMSAMSKDARIQMDQELLQMAANPIFASYMKPDRILRKWMLDRGWKNPEGYIKSQEELLIEQRQAMAAQQMAGGGTMGGAQGGQLEGGVPQDAGGATPSEAGPTGQANQPALPQLQQAGMAAQLAGGQLAPGGLVSPAV